MKKEIITLVVILLFVIIFNIITQKYTNQEMSNIEESLLRVKRRNNAKKRRKYKIQNRRNY